MTVTTGHFVAKILLAPVQVAYLLGRIRIIIPESTQRVLQAGNVMVVSNHPSFIETFGMRVALETLSNSAVWSIAADDLFVPQWYEAFQCIAVSRAGDTSAKRTNVKAFRKQDAILTAGGMVVLYPEGTRTVNAREHVLANDGRRIGVCHTDSVKRAQEVGASIVPVWVDHGDCSAPQGFLQGYRKLFFSQPPMTLHFGEVYKGDGSQLSVAEAILAAGQCRVQ